MGKVEIFLLPEVSKESGKADKDDAKDSGVELELTAVEKDA